MFGDEWLDKIGQVQRDRGYQLIGNLPSGGFAESSSAALPTLLGRLDADDNDRISKAEAESVDLRLSGWSFGATQAVNFSYDLSRADERIGGYRLEHQIEVQRLVTLDPVKFLYLGGLPIFPFKVLKGRVKDNVQIFVNQYQKRRGATFFEQVDAQGQVVQRSDMFRTFGANFIAGDEVPTDLVAPLATQLRVDVDQANLEEVRDRVSANTRDAIGDTDPLFNNLPDEPRWRLFGDGPNGVGVNHDTLPWYAYRRTINELA